MPSLEEKICGISDDDDLQMDIDEEKTADDSSDESCSDDSSVLDEGECDRRRTECLDGMSDLERQFDDLKELLFKERVQDVETKLEEVKAGRAHEYLNPLSQLQENMRVRTQVAGILRELKLVSIKIRHEAELNAAAQHFHSETSLLQDYVEQELEDRIRRLEEDRTNIDLCSDLWDESQKTQKRKRDRHDPFGYDRRRKPITVSGPYVVYMLRENDIVEDWTAIKKALKHQSTQKRVAKSQYVAHFEDNRLYYSGNWYRKGDRIIIENREDGPEYAVITQLNPTEVWVKRNNFTKTKLYIAQLQKGKYTMRHAIRMD